MCRAMCYVATRGYLQEVFADKRGVLEEVAAAATGPLRQLATELYHVVS